MSKKVLSESMSFKGWRLWEFVKGRKKMIITVIAAICGYFAFDQSLTGLLVGPVFEGIWSVAEYYFKTIRE